MADNILTSEVLEPYAQALMSLGQSNDLVDRFGEDVNNILDTLNASEELKDFIVNPLAKGDLKKRFYFRCLVNRYIRLLATS